MKKYNFSYSFAKDIKQHGVKYAIDKKENRKDSFNFGSAYHLFVLEPEKFAKTYVTCELNKSSDQFKFMVFEYGAKKEGHKGALADLNRHKILTNIEKTNKEEKAELKILKADLKCCYDDYWKKYAINFIDPELIEQFKEMKQSLMENKEVKDVLEHPQTERELIFEKEINGDNFKGILDIYNSELECGYDLKTCSSVDPDSISYQVKTMLYDAQFYMYYNLADLRKFKFIFQEDSFPYYTRIVELDDEWYSRGENFIHEAYTKWLEYQTFGEVTAKESVLIEMPGYIRYADETQYNKIEWEKADLPF